VDQPGETALARALVAGQPEAFERFVEHFRSKVFHYSWLMCGRPEDAEEVAQETLLKVFENFGQLREPERVRPWIFRIAKNACLMHRRKSLFAPAHELSLDELPPAEEVADGARPPDAELLRSELRAVLDRVIAELPPVYRAVVLLRDIEELSTEETAQILDLSADVVKTRLHRGRLAMRQKLDCYLHDHCLEDQPSPNPAPLTPKERRDLYSIWQNRVAAGPAAGEATHP
jgi:RNA polymerase sigma-70 factor (ECF subfamily)